MKILMISPQFRPIVGGYERAAERLATELGREGHMVTVITERRYRHWLAHEQESTFLIRRLWCIYRPRLHMTTSLLSFGVFLLLHGRRYDIFHVHQYGYHAALAVLQGRLLRRPVVLKITNTGPDGISQALTGGVKAAPFLRWLHTKVDACIGTTSPARQEAVAFGIPEQRTVLLPNGVDTEQFAPCDPSQQAAVKKRLGLMRRHTVLFCGRLSSEKNPDGLIEAWKLAQVEGLDAELVFVGDGPMRQAVETGVKRQAMENIVRVAGQQESVLPWYQAADIFVLPSHHEGLSNSLLEAMSCGLPVVSTRVSGSEEILSQVDAGELVDVGDVVGLAGAIRRLLLDASRRAACGARARTFVRARYSMTAIAQATIQLYERVIQAAGTADGSVGRSTSADGR